MTDRAPIQEQIKAGRFEAALAECDRRLAEHPDDSELLYMAAVCCRCLRRHGEALQRLDRLKALAPEHGRACQEEGHLHRDRGDRQAALAAYARACQYNPALLAAWRAQFEILESSGNSHKSAFVRRRLIELEALPKPLLGALDLIGQGKPLKAENICRQFLKRVPHHVEAMRLLADIGVRLGVLDDAEFLLESAAKFDPDNEQVRIDYIQVLRKKQKFAAAREEAQKLLAGDPDNLQFRSLFAIQSMQTGDYDEALRVFDGILEFAPGDPITLTSRGHALKTIGDYSNSVNSYRQALSYQPRHCEAWYSLANLKTYQFADAQIEAMLGLRDNPDLSHMDRVYLSFALGKAMEDRGDYEQAFRHYSAGNALKKAQSRYSADQMHAEFEAQQRVCDEGLLARRHSSGCPAPDPVFIVGLPRAGSTLLEQILASHSEIDGTLELPNILSLSHKLRRGEEPISATNHYPDILPELSDEQLREYGEQFISDTRIHRQNAPFFIDKMPNNFRHIGLIKLILPNAKIINASRQPLACCFSGFKQLFAEGQEFSYSLQDIGRYYCDYMDLMAHWNRVLPAEILTVNHEDIVADLEGQVRRMLDFCELPFEQACVEYHRTSRSVRTPSSEQVRQPIFRDSLDAWQNFEPWLKPLKEALGRESGRDLPPSDSSRTPP